jgi:hypothetical protein
MKLLFVMGLLGTAAFAAPTYNKDVLPIVQRSCQNCHRPGQVAPMSFLSYAKVRPWAKAMKQAVQTRKMPPWMADSEHSLKFANDRSLKQSEIDTISAWADSGAPEGDAKDKPQPVAFNDDGWLLGQPDLIIQMKPYTVPKVEKNARGIVEDKIPFVNVYMPTGLTKDMWIRALEIKPGNRAVVHHVGVDAVSPDHPQIKGKEPFVGYTDDRPSAGNARPAAIASVNRSLTPQLPGAPVLAVPQASLDPVGLGGFSPGHEFYNFNSARPEAARLLPANTWLSMQIHYTSSGIKDEQDATRVGLYFLKEPPKYRYMQLTVSDRAPVKEIPWGESNFEVKRSATVQTPIEAAVLIPHMHWRGKDMTYRVTYPSGETQTLLTVNRYQFDWQLAYELDKPLSLPKGTKIEVTAHYDNSPNNRLNPYVGEAAVFGDQTWQEMFIGFLGALVPVDQSVKGLISMNPRGQ